MERDIGPAHVAGYGTTFEESAGGTWEDLRLDTLPSSSADRRRGRS